MSLDVALGSLTLGSAGDVQLCADFEVRGGDRLTDFVVFVFVQSEFAQILLAGNAGLCEVASFGLGQSVFFLIFETELYSLVAVGLFVLELGDHAGASFNDGHRDHFPCFGEDLGHSDLLS